MSIELTEELRRNKAQFRYLRERCGISLRETAERCDYGLGAVRSWERGYEKTYPPIKAWEYLLEQFENHKNWVSEHAEQIRRAAEADIEEDGYSLGLISIYHYQTGAGATGKEDNREENYRLRRFNARAAELAAVLSFENIEADFFYENHEISDENIEKATFRGIRERCRITQKTVAEELGYKELSTIRKWEYPDARPNVPERAFEWAEEKLERHIERTDAILEIADEITEKQGYPPKQVLFPYYTSQKHFNLYKTDSISFSEINAANTEAAARLEKLGIEPVFLYPETGYKYPSDYRIKTDNPINFFRKF